MDKDKLKYYIDKWNETENLETWESFYESMTENGFVMDSYESFRTAFPDVQGVKSTKEKSVVVEKLKTAERQIVGNFIFSHWRYLTHWSYGFDVKKEREYFKELFEVLLCKS